MGSSVISSEVQPLLIDIHSNDRLGSHSFGYSHGQQPNRASTHDQDVHVGSALSLCGHGVDGDGERFHHGTVL